MRALRMLNQLKTTAQRLLPKQLITQLVGWLADRRLGLLTTWLIKLFIKYYKVNMKEAHNREPESYSTFNAFFTRKLHHSARHFHKSPNTIIAPVDGIISECGLVHEGRLMQAKGHCYSLDALLACNTALVSHFIKGSYLTFYLSPKDYHRVHMPCAGKLCEMIYVPGSLFSVGFTAAATVANLFARNERVICYFETEFGPMVQILIGATIVGSIETPWHGVVTPPRENILKRWIYRGVELGQGEEMGCFRLGSTVITLFAEQRVALSADCRQGLVTRLGTKLGERIQ